MTNQSEITTSESIAISKRNMDIIKRNIKRLLGEKKMAQSDLAFVVQSNAPFISYFLRRSGNCTIDFLGRIAHALDTTISELAKK